LGYYWTEKLFIYGSYWITKSKITILYLDGDYGLEEEILVPNFGITYNLTDRIRMKAQYARVKTNDTLREAPPSMLTKKEDNFSVYSLAVSVFF
jgi:hypothetical protein